MHIFASYDAIIKKPPAMEKFFKKAIICIWLLKSVWKITDTVIVNKNIKSDLFLNQFSRIESEYNLSENIYNELALNKEKIAIDVRKNTPIFTVIKPVVIPNDRFEPKRSIIVLIYSFLGIIISSFWVLIKNPFFNIITNIRSK